MNKKTTGFVVIALIVGFAAGYLLHPASAAPSVATGSGARAGGFAGRAGNMAAGGFLSGTVASVNSSSMTLNTRDGSSHVILLTPATTVSKSVSGAVSDVSVGATVMVSGSTNSDGSVSAANITLRPAMPTTPAATTPQ